MANLRNVLLRLTGDPSEARRAVGEITDDLKRLDKLSPEARVRIEDEGAKAKLDKLYKRLNSLSAREATPEIKIATASTLRQIDRVEKGLGNVDHTNKDVVRSNARLRTSFGNVWAHGGAAFAAIGGAYALKSALFSVVGAYGESQKSQARLRAQLKALNIDFNQHALAIDLVIQKVSKLSGIDDEELQDSFVNIVRSTGDVSKALKLVGLSADIARAKNIDVAKAGVLLAKVSAGNTSALSRYGIVLRKNATTTEALAILQKKFGGQAKAYGRTQQGAADRANVAFENLKETLGKSLSPILTKVLNKTADFVNQMVEGRGAGGRFAHTVRGVASTVSTVVRAIVKAIGPFARLAFNLTKGAVNAIKFVASLGPVRTAFRIVMIPAKLLWHVIDSLADSMERVIHLAKKLGDVLGIGDGPGDIRSIAERLRRQADRQPGTRFTGPHDAGGLITGSGGPDSLFSPVSPGEFVLRRRAVQAIGLGNVRALNAATPGGGGMQQVNHWHVSAPSPDYVASRWEHRTADAMRRRGVAFAR